MKAVMPRARWWRAYLDWLQWHMPAWLSRRVPAWGIDWVEVDGAHVCRIVRGAA